MRIPPDHAAEYQPTAVGGPVKLSSSVPSQRVAWRSAPPVALAISTWQPPSALNRAKAISRPSGGQLGKRSLAPTGGASNWRAGALPEVCTLIAPPPLPSSLAPS
ncbi:hypothetical protein G6F40_017508 [Rhizopus arrhizus]|nr:hypothetical protein G6F40_017508 [Rhizopus arrhizus]